MSKDDEQQIADGTMPAEPDTDRAGVDEAVIEPALGGDSADESSEPVGESGEPDIQIEPLRVVEAVLMAADAPITAQKIANIMGVGTGRDVKKHIEALNEQYDEWDVSFRVEELAGGYQILTQPQFNNWLKKLLRVRAETKLTGAAMETLAIVAYKQPCTRADVEAVRGVAVGEVMNRLRDMNMMKIVGRAEDLGRPILYGTTRRFLEVFGLGSIDDLPQVEALKPGGKAVAKSEAAKDAADEGDAMASNRDDGYASHESGEDAAVIGANDDAENGSTSNNDEDEAPSLALVNDDDAVGDEAVTADEQRRAANE